MHTFSATEPQWGFTALAPRARLLDPAAGFLRPDGALLLRATCRPVAEPGGGL